MFCPFLTQLMPRCRLTFNLRPCDLSGCRPPRDADGPRPPPARPFPLRPASPRSWGVWGTRVPLAGKT